MGPACVRVGGGPAARSLRLFAHTLIRRRPPVSFSPPAHVLLLIHCPLIRSVEGSESSCTSISQPATGHRGNEQPMGERMQRAKVVAWATRMFEVHAGSNPEPRTQCVSECDLVCTRQICPVHT